MKTRRGFLQTIGAALGSTMLPGGAIAAVAGAPVAAAFSLEVPPAAAAAVAAVARQFKTSVVMDPHTFEPKMAVAIVGEEESQLLGTSFKIEPIIDATPEMYDAFTDEQSKKRLSLMVIRTALEKEGLPPLTPEEESLILEQTKETA